MNEQEVRVIPARRSQLATAAVCTEQQHMEVASCSQSYRTQLIRVRRGLATCTRVRTTTAEVPNSSHEPTTYNNSYCSSAAVVVVTSLLVPGRVQGSVTKVVCLPVCTNCVCSTLLTSVFLLRAVRVQFSQTQELWERASIG